MPPPVPVLLIMPEKVSFALEIVNAILPRVTDPDPERLLIAVPPELPIAKVPFTVTLLDAETLPPLPKVSVAPLAIVVRPV